jgi:signal transduction histidine kinase
VSDEDRPPARPATLAEARVQAERFATRVRRLQTVTTRLSRVLAVPEVAAVAVEEGTVELGADTGGLWLLDEAAQDLDMVRSRGYPEEALRRFQRVAVSADVPLGDCVRTGRAVWLETRREFARRYPISEARVRGVNDREDLAVACLPLRADERVLGALAFAFHGERVFDETERSFLLALADHCAQAIARSRQHQQLEAASRAKDEFLAMLGHELRNPLSPILTALELMRLRGAATDAQPERQVIERQVRNLMKLVDDLLDVSRITRGNIQLDKEPIEVSAVVAKAVEAASPLLEQRAHRLALRIPAAGLRVDADPTRLAQVLSNLLINAAKYTPSGGDIAVDASREAADIAIRVRDTGSGIAPDLLPRLFDLFVQGDRRPDRAPGGLGIGLTVARALVEQHGGTISARSDGPGRGSEFVVRLPARLDAATSAAPASAAEPPPRADGTRILVVDDNEDAAEGLALSLKLRGYLVRMAHDAPSALEAAREFRPKVALLDIGLPVMDGYELAARLRKLPGLADVRFIAVTGYGQESDRARSRAAGFHAHLVKPADFGKILRAIED